MKNKHLEKRYNKTLSFVKKHTSVKDKILDLGTENPFSLILRKEGYVVENTKGENLDIDYSAYLDRDVDLITSFEIFEHMLAPFNILRELKTEKLIASVPLKLWFTNAYWNENDDWDKHYHEFEIKQFNFLLKQSGWIIKDYEIWTSSDWKKIGIRPILRHFTPRYYIIYCERTIANKN